MTDRCASHRTRIKICGLTREQDVDAAVAAGADAVGFVLYAASPRDVIGRARGANWRARLPPFVTPVLLFVNEAPDRSSPRCATVPGAIAAVPWRRNARAVPGRPAAAARDRYMRAARIPLGDGRRAFDLVKYASDYSRAQAILLDAHVEGYGGGGKAFDWSLLPPSVNAHLVLSGGLTPANVADGIRAGAAALQDAGR